MHPLFESGEVLAIIVDSEITWCAGLGMRREGKDEKGVGEVCGRICGIWMANSERML